MSRRVTIDDEWDDDYESGDCDGVDKDGDATVSCPYCSRDIPEDTPRCPYCETYISEEDAPPAKKPWWIVIGVVICLYIVYRWHAG